MADRCKSRVWVLSFRCTRPMSHSGKHKASEKEIRKKIRQLIDRLVKKERENGGNTSN
jgi:hypothetical protein